MKNKTKWFCAHVILYHKLKKRKQARYLIWEQVVLVRAASRKSALTKVSNRSKQYAKSVSPKTIGGETATVVFGGVRKLMECWEDPGDLVEITYNELWVDDRQTVQKYIRGKDARVLSIV